jgi:hypothetical protein
VKLSLVQDDKKSANDYLTVTIYKADLTLATQNSKISLVGAWLSLVERYLGVVEAAGSNPVAPTSELNYIPTP